MTTHGVYKQTVTTCLFTSTVAHNSVV